MIQSKGFKQAYVRMDNETVDVVVDAVSTDDIPEEPAPNSVPEPAAEGEKKPEE